MNPETLEQADYADVAALLQNGQAEQARQIAVQIQTEHVRAAALVLCDRSKPI